MKKIFIAKGRAKDNPLILHVSDKNMIEKIAKNITNMEKNIIDKLTKYEVDFISAYLGNTENKEEFIKSQTSIPQMRCWRIRNTEIKEIEKSLKQRYKHLQEKLEQQNKLSKLKQELSAYKLEYSHHLKYIEQF